MKNSSICCYFVATRYRKNIFKI